MELFVTNTRDAMPRNSSGRTRTARLSRPIKPKHDIGNMLNKAIAAFEEENDFLAGYSTFY
jgi:hypothetical protein